MKQRTHNEILQEHNDQNNNDGGQIDAAKRNGQASPDLVENGFGDIINEPNDGIVRIGADPRENGPNDNDPHVDEQNRVDDFSQSHQEVSQGCHIDTF